MKTLLIVTAILELGAGAALLVAPSAVAAILLGLPLDTQPGLTVGRVAGAALLTIGVACLLGRNGERRAAVGLIAAALLYNVAVAGILGFSAVAVGLSGIGLWPAVLLHTALAGWCAACLRPGR